MLAANKATLTEKQTALDAQAELIASLQRQLQNKNINITFDKTHQIQGHDGPLDATTKKRTHPTTPNTTAIATSTSRPPTILVAGQHDR